MALLSKYLSKARYARILPYVQGDVLDIGCQHGQLRDQARGRIGRYAGIDISSEAIAKASAAHPDCEFRVVDMDDEPIGFDGAFDTIVMCAVIEHLFNLKHLGRGIARALRPGGRAVLTTPTPFGNDIVHRLGAAVGLFSKVAVDDHIVIFNRKRFEIFAAECGLQLAEHRLFQLGCNQLAVLAKPTSQAQASARQ